MRNTIHLVASVDVPWLQLAFGPLIQRRFSSVRWPSLGLTPALLSRAAAAVPDVLRGRQLTRHELVVGLADAGVAVPSDPQAPTHLVVYLATIGLVCHAADRGRDSTFALVSDWLPSGPSVPSVPRGDEALGELARRFFTSFSPATAADFTAWSGLPSSRAIAQIRDELTPADVLGRPGFRLGTVEPARGVRLLGAFDNYLIGYRDRTPMLRPEIHRDVFVGGIIRPTVLLDGRVIGRWRQVRRSSSAEIEVTPYEPFSRRVRAAVDAEVADLGRFLGTPTSLTVRAD